MTLVDLEFVPARDAILALDVEAATVPGAAPSRGAVNRRVSKPVVVERDLRAWAGDVVVRVPRADGSAWHLVLSADEAKARISARS